MSDNQENKLPDATTNQSTENEISVNETKNEKIKPEVVNTTEEKAEIKLKPAAVEVKKEIKEETVETNKEVEVETKVEKKIEDASTKEPKEESKEEPKEEPNKAIDEIEKEVAKKSENLGKVPEVPLTDYEALDLASVVATIKSLVDQHPIQALKKHVDVLKRVFNSKFGLLLKEAKEKFLEEGGETLDFNYKNPIQKEYNDTLFDYKKRLKKHYSEIEKQYDENLLLKNKVIDDLKELIDNGEANSMYKNFQEIQKKWREIGPVSRSSYSDLWQTYHFHTERFYDLLHLRNDLRDLDFKHNLDEKLKIIVKAEVLAEQADIHVAFDELQNLHRIWKEELGPVSREMREVVWEKFSEATKKIHDRRHEYYDSLKEVYQENFDKKIKIIEQIEAFDTSGNSSHKDWQKSIKSINTFREEFFAIGKVSRNKNKEVWNRFKEATKDFNRKKNDYYKEIKNEQQENLDKKMKLVEQAESLRESDDWDSVTDVMKRIQAEWRTIGFVPRKHSDKIWNRFKEACNYYFDRLHNKQEAVDEEKMEVFHSKETYLENLKEEAKDEAFKPDIEQLKKYISDWRAIGTVPISKRAIDGKFNKFLDSYFDKLSLNKKESTLLRYRNLMDSLVEQKDFRKIQNEVQFVRKRLEEVNKEKQQLENNMLFFSNADDSNPMIKNIKKTISKHADELEIWKAKLSHLRTLDV
ncbi:MAG TPA: DUF349 domain-containing protein [Lutibacter sp.]|nr:DUF349 domain-containing protein [Lutibacter sp.]